MSKRRLNKATLEGGEMKCKDCNTEHPDSEIANPHYCIARMGEIIDKCVEQDKQIATLIAENKRLTKALERADGVLESPNYAKGIIQEALRGGEVSDE